MPAICTLPAAVPVAFVRLDSVPAVATPVWRWNVVAVTSKWLGPAILFSAAPAVVSVQTDELLVPEMPPMRSMWMIGLMTARSNVIVTVPVAPAAPAALNTVEKSAVFCALLENAAMLFSTPTAVLVQALAEPLNVTVVFTPSVVFTAVVASSAVLAAAFVKTHGPPTLVLLNASVPFQRCSTRPVASMCAVWASRLQLPPSSALPVVSVEAATSAPVASASASTKAWPFAPAATSQP